MPAYLAADPPIESPQQLEQHPVLLPTLGVLAKEFVFKCQDSSAEPDVVFRPSRSPIESDNSDAMLAAAMAGYGLDGALSFVTQAPLDAGRLMRVLPNWHVDSWHVQAVYQRQGSLTTAARVLLEHLRSRLGGGETDPWLSRADS